MTELAPLPEVYVPTLPVPHAEVKDPENTPGSPSPPGPGASGPAPALDDDVHLVVDGATMSGWQRVLIVRGIEIMPSHFDIAMTERYSGDASRTDVKAGDPCQVKIGGTLVLTGYIDRVLRVLGPEGSKVRIMGRSKCADLVDCSINPADVRNMQMGSSTLLQIAQKVASSYSVDVRAIGDAGSHVTQQLNINLGETPWQLIERLAAVANVLAYDEVDGSLVLAPAGAGAMASGFAEGINIERAQSVEAMDQRYSDYEVYLTSSNVLSDIAPMTPESLVQDKEVPRFRKLILISEQGQLDVDVARKRGEWEKARRYGRSQPITIVTDSWCDRSGTLWHVNTSVPVTAPHLKVVGATRLIGQVVFRRDERGTHAELVVMPKEAFNPQPIIQYPFDVQTAKGLGAPDPAPQGPVGTGPSTPPDRKSDAAP